MTCMSLRHTARIAFALAVALGAAACDSGTPNPPRTASVQVTGAYASSYDTDASFRTRSSDAEVAVVRAFFAYLPFLASNQFTIALSDGPNAPVYLYINRGTLERPAVGRYPITNTLEAAFYPSSRFYAGILYHDPTELRRVASQSGYVEITRSDPGLLEGTFEFQAVGRGPSDSGLSADGEVTVRGSFQAREH